MDLWVDICLAQYYLIVGLCLQQHSWSLYRSDKLHGRHYPVKIWVARGDARCDRLRFYDYGSIGSPSWQWCKCQSRSCDCWYLQCFLRGCLLPDERSQCQEHTNLPIDSVHEYAHVVHKLVYRQVAGSEHLDLLIQRRARLPRLPQLGGQRPTNS